MYLGEEGEFDGVADIGFDVVGAECEGAIADRHGDSGSLCDCCRGSSEDGGREMHAET
jgi:hypothetical protein